MELALVQETSFQLLLHRLQQVRQPRGRGHRRVVQKARGLRQESAAQAAVRDRPHEVSSLRRNVRLRLLKHEAFPRLAA